MVGHLQKDWQKLFEKLILIDSSTKNVFGVNQIQQTLAFILKSLGLQCQFIKNQETQSGHALVASLRSYNPYAKKVTFVCHADTVKSWKGEFLPKPVNDGKKIVGPGALDNKSGIIVLVKTLEKFLKLNRHPSHQLNLHLTIVCSPNEEMGSPGFHELFKKIGLESDLILGLEPGLPTGNIIHQRNGNRWYEIQVTGHGGHSGRFIPGQVNAIHEMAEKIVKIHRLNDHDNKIKINIGHIEGGRGNFNVVCDQVSAHLDLRFPTLEDRNALHHEILKILDDSHLSCPVEEKTCATNFKVIDDCPPMHNLVDDQKILTNLCANHEKLWSEEISWEFCGGCSDVNHFSNKYNIAIDGLGGIGGNMHKADEWVDLESIEKRSSLISDFLKSVNNEQILMEGRYDFDCHPQKAQPLQRTTLY